MPLKLYTPSRPAWGCDHAHKGAGQVWPWAGQAACHANAFSLGSLYTYFLYKECNFDAGQLLIVLLQIKEPAALAIT